MKSKALWMGGVAVAAIVAGGAYYALQQGGGMHSGGGDFAVMATPPGITLEIVGGGRQGRDVIPAVTVYANAKGLTLYTYDKDEPGKSNCTGDCAKVWIPASVGPTAKTFGDWSVVSREDGSKQWAVGGKPLYTFVKDKEPGYLSGNAPRLAVGGAPAAQQKKPEEMQAGWHAASFKPLADLKLPGGIELREVPDAFGQVLVDEHDMTLYAFSGDAKNDKQVCVADTPSCADRWRPVPAPELANPVGDFSVVNRADGSKQWAYKGQALYTYAGDIIPGVAHGINADPMWHVATMVRYFTPATVSVHMTLNFGDSLTTADGMTVYRRDAKPFQTSGHALPKNLTGIPETGRTIGTRGCDADCQKTWKPLVAPADAQPSGYFDVVTDEHGTKQWAYKGYALYTYAGDKKPGDMTGHDIYDILVNDNLQKTSYSNLSMALGPLIPNYAISLYWTYAAP